MSVFSCLLFINRSSTFTSKFAAEIQYSGHIQYLEHVIVRMSVEVANIGRRGDIEIELLSPSGTTSTLLGQRPRDYRASGYIEWPFMSVMFWGEDPAGNWSLSVSSGSTETVIEISDIRFQFFGVSHTPDSVATIPTKCHDQCARGCAKNGSNFCDACVNLRNAYTLECIDTCPPEYTEHNGYCYNPSLPVQECDSPLKVKNTGED